MGFKNPELVFKTTSPDAIAWYEKLEQLRAEELKLRIAFEEEMLQLYGPSQKPTYERNDDGSKKDQERRALWIRGDIAYALDSGYSEYPPEDSGWRLDSKDHNWQPKLKTAAGKKWAKRLSELNLVHMRSRWQEIGIPFLFWGEGYVYYPGMDFDQETKTLYIGWGTQYAEEQFLKETSAFPSIEWDRVPLSEWHARREAMEAAKGEKE